MRLGNEKEVFERVRASWLWAAPKALGSVMRGDEEDFRALEMVSGSHVSERKGFLFGRPEAVRVAFD